MVQTQAESPGWHVLVLILILRTDKVSGRKSSNTTVLVFVRRSDRSSLKKQL